jgi:acyl dehydratase
MKDRRVVPGWTGRIFEDFTVGDVFRHPLGKTITAVDNAWFTHLTLNTNPIHFDSAYAAQTEFGRPLVNSCLTLALVTGMSVADLSQNAFANLGWDRVRLPAPVFEGDTLYAESEVLETRPSQSRSNVGIVRVRTCGFKPNGVVVIEFERTILIYRKGHTPELGLPAPAVD